MAVLTSTGIQFSAGNTIDSKYQIFPQTSAVVFWQASAPTGWVTVTTHNNKALRVVSGAAGNSGGTNDFTTTMASRPLSATVPVTVNGVAGQPTTLDANTIPAHAHPANAGANVSASGGGAARVANVGSTGAIGNGGGHTHPVTVNAASGPINTSIDFAVQYIDTIYCTFS